MRIPLSVPTYGQEEVDEVNESLQSTWVTMGKKVERFEKMWAEYIGVEHAVMVNSGSSANLLALGALDLQKGSEVITPALTWATTVWPIIQLGLVPVLVDVDKDTFNINAASAKRAATRKTGAVMPVHLLGNPCSTVSLLFAPLIEDACEAHGATVNGLKVGSMGDLGTFSFFFSHHISTIEGGMITTHDKDLADKLRQLRAFGWVRGQTPVSDDIDPRFQFVSLGYNMRPAEIQGAFGIHQLPKLEGFLQARQYNALWFNECLPKYSDYLTVMEEQPNTRHAWFMYPVTVKETAPFTRKELVDFLESKGLETRPVMAGNITRQPAMQGQNYRVSGNLTNTDYIHKNTFLFGCHQGIGPKERLAIESYFEEFFDAVER